MKDSLQRTEQWHQDRSMKISGSRIASVLKTPTAFTSREKLMDEFLREWHGLEKKTVSDFTQKIFDWGTDHEPDAEVAFCKEFGCEIEHYGFVSHPTYDFIGVSPDGVAIMPDGNRVLAEFKCPYSNKIPEDAPQHYIDQCQLSMEVLDLDVAILYYWTISPLGDPITEHFYIRRDPKWWDRAEAACQAFWEEFLVRREQPYEEEPEITIVASTDALTVAAALREVVHERLALQAREAQLKTELKTWQAEEGDTQVGCFKIIRTATKGAVDTTLIENEFNIDIDDYRKEMKEIVKVTEIKEKKDV